jgi:hypothetical protein
MHDRVRSRGDPERGVRIIPYTDPHDVYGDVQTLIDMLNEKGIYEIECDYEKAIQLV